MSPGERDEFWAALCSLEEEQLFHGAISEREKAILDEEMQEYQADPRPGAPWAEVKSRLLPPS